MVLFCVRIQAYHPSASQDYILGSGMSHGNSSSVFPLCQAAGAGGTQMHQCCSGSLCRAQRAESDINISDTVRHVSSLAHSDGHK